MFGEPVLNYDDYEEDSVDFDSDDDDYDESDDEESVDFN